MRSQCYSLKMTRTATSEDALKEIDRIYKLIGMTVVGFGRLESVIQDLISVLANARSAPPVLLLLKDNHFSKNADFVRELARLRTPADHPLRKELEELVSTLKSLASKRNFYLHGVWQMDILTMMEKGFVICRTPKLTKNPAGEEGWSLKSQEVTATQLKDEIHAIDAAFAAVMKIQFPVIEHLKSLKGWHEYQLNAFKEYPRDDLADQPPLPSSEETKS